MNYFIIMLLVLLASVAILIILSRFLPNKGSDDSNEEDEE